MGPSVLFRVGCIDKPTAERGSQRDLFVAAVHPQIGDRLISR
jgi:hypothetical protein